MNSDPEPTDGPEFRLEDVGVDQVTWPDLLVDRVRERALAEPIDTRPGFDVTETWSELQQMYVARMIRDLLRLLRDLLAALFGITGRGFLTAGEILDGATDGTEQYLHRFRRRLGGAVMLHELTNHLQSEDGNLVDGLHYRTPRQVWRTTVWHEASYLPRILIGRFDRIKAFAGGIDVSTIGISVKRKRRKGAVYFQVTDSFGHRLNLSAEPCLLLFAFAGRGVESIGGFLMKAIEGGQDAVRLTVLNEHLQAQRDGRESRPTGVRLPRVPTLTAGWFGKVKLSKGNSAFPKGAQLGVKLHRREFGRLLRLSDSFGNRLKLPEGAGLLLLSFYHGSARLDLARLTQLACQRGVNTDLLKEFRQDLVTEIRIREEN